MIASASLLILVAIGLASLLFPIAFIYALIICSDRYTYLHRIALGIDELGNTVCGPLFNRTLINFTLGYHFGQPGETISSALGKNVERNTLTYAGRLLNALLNKIEKNHSIISIDNQIVNNDNKI